jgi:hypothetical protein
MDEEYQRESSNDSIQGNKRHSIAPFNEYSFVQLCAITISLRPRHVSSTHFLFHFTNFEGLANRIIKELELLDEDGATNMLKLFAAIGARREAFAKCDFTGNAVRMILMRAHEIANCFADADTQTQEKAEKLAGLMRHLSHIQTNLKVCSYNFKIIN